MRATRVRFTIRWLMETTAIMAIALSLLRFSAEAWFVILNLLTLYVCGLCPCCGSMGSPRCVGSSLDGDVVICQLTQRIERGTSAGCGKDDP